MVVRTYCYVWWRSQKQTWANAEIVVYSSRVQWPGNQRYINPNGRQKSSQKRAVVQNQKAENQKYRGAGRNRSQRVNQLSKPKIRKADKQKGLGKLIIGKQRGVIYNISIRLAYTESAQNNDQRSDRVCVYSWGIYTQGETNKLCGSRVWGGTKQSTKERTHWEWLNNHRADTKAGWDRIQILYT